MEGALAVSDLLLPVGMGQAVSSARARRQPVADSSTPSAFRAVFIVTVIEQVNPEANVYFCV